MSEPHPHIFPSFSETPLAGGAGWRAVEVVCRGGPHDAPTEERHERVSVAAVLGGSFVYHSSGGRVLMSPGSVLLGNYQQCYCCSHWQGAGDRCVAFQCEPAFVEEIAADLRGVRSAYFAGHRLTPQQALMPLFSDIQELTRSPAGILAEEVALRLMGAALRLSQSGSEPAVTFRDEARVTDAIARIEASSGDSICLAMLASDAQISRHHFLRVFRRVTGVTPYAYILARRLQVAAYALSSGEESVLDVALAAGFSDLSEFTRRFHVAFGLPPGRYRRERKAREKPEAMMGKRRPGIGY